MYNSFSAKLQLGIRKIWHISTVTNRWSEDQPFGWRTHKLIVKYSYQNIHIKKQQQDPSRALDNGYIYIHTLTLQNWRNKVAKRSSLKNHNCNYLYPAVKFRTTLDPALERIADVEVTLESVPHTTMLLFIYFGTSLKNIVGE